jgi:ATP-dependent Lon protease
MLKGEWTLNTSYQRGDIVFIFNQTTSLYNYYVCAIEHISDDLVNPRNPEEIYWIEISDMFQGFANHPNRFTFDPSTFTFDPNAFTFDTNLVQPPPVILPNLVPPIPILDLPPPPGLHRQKRKQKCYSDTEYEEENKKDDKLKRKLKNVEKDINLFKKRRKLDDSTLDLKQQIMLLNVDVETKVFLLDKYESLQRQSNSDYAKSKTWLKTVLNIPFGRYKPFKVRSSDPSDKINEYFKMVREHLDKKVHNMDKVKDEIMEFLARKISNPHSKGHVLALCGPPGCAKTVILKSLAEALELPFYQINFGGLNDVSVLTGHSETYVGSKPGKLVEILTSAGCMNPIIYLDEIDKISEHKGREINGILTHLLDEEQNNKFQDNYLSNININLSKALFVIAFNDHEKVDRIVSDRMKVIYIDTPTTEDKVVIASNKMIPDIINTLNIKKDKFINLDEELLKYIIQSKVPKEEGVRQLRKSLEKIFNKINYLFLTGQYRDSTLNITTTNNEECLSELNTGLSLMNLTETVHITKNFIDLCLESQSDNTSYAHMYL